MEFDDNTQEYILEEQDKEMLLIGWDRIAMQDRDILLAANQELQKRTAKAAEAVEGDNYLAEAVTARDVEYSKIYSRNLLNLIHQHRPRTPRQQ
jgi:hypothetical protein